MVRSQPSKSTEELIAALDQLSDADEFDTSAGAVTSQSVRRLVEKQGGQVRLLRARFVGAATAGHEIGVRVATSVLGELQEAVSEVGAVLREVVPQRGPLPGEILSATELKLSTRLMTGSVIFTMQPPRDAGLWPEDDTLLEQSLSTLFEIFDKIERPMSADGTPETIADGLNALGPRTARHLFKFADALKSGDLSLDLRWARTGRDSQSTSLSVAGARFLSDFAEKATSRTTDAILVGTIRNLGTDNSHKLMDNERGLISFKTSDAITDALHPTFRQGQVTLKADETEKINVATGRSTRSFVVTELVEDDE